jgi:hypothetical protein
MRNLVRSFSALALVAVAIGSTGCSKPIVEGPPAASQPPQGSEAAKTQELEQKAADIKDRYQEIQASEMTAEEKAQATQQLVDEQQKAIQEADSGSSGENPQ